MHFMQNSVLSSIPLRGDKNSLHLEDRAYSSLERFDMDQFLNFLVPNTITNLPNMFEGEISILLVPYQIVNS